MFNQLIYLLNSICLCFPLASPYCFFYLFFAIKLSFFLFDLFFKLLQAFFMCLMLLMLVFILLGLVSLDFIYEYAEVFKDERQFSDNDAMIDFWL